MGKIKLILLSISITLISLVLTSGSGDYELSGRKLKISSNTDSYIYSPKDDVVSIVVDGTPTPRYITANTRFTKTYYKTIDQTFTSTTLVTDNNLRFTPTADTLFYIEADLWWDRTAAGTVVPKVGFIVPAGAEFDGILCFEETTDVQICDDITESTTVATFSTSKTAAAFFVKGILKISSTSGTAGLRFAKSSATAENLTIKLESNFSWTELN